MDKLISFVLYPVIPSNRGEPDETSGIEFVYPLTIFFTFGIWLVSHRYYKMHNSPVPFTINAPRAADPEYVAHPISDPHLESHLQMPDLMPGVTAPGRRYITSYDPATGLHLGTFMADNEVEISGKIARAANAQKSWRRTSFTQRRRVIRSLMKWLVENQDLCARVACRDTGKTLIDAVLGEILTTCSKMDWLINHGERVLAPERRARNLLLTYKNSEVHFEPLGVVAAIVSWNYPLHNAWSPILAAIFSGNGIVLKCSENVIWSTHWFVDAINACLDACGHDADLVQVVSCWPEQAEALTKSPHIKHITFIGSEEVGKKVAKAATENLTPVTLELGGKDPAIVLPDTNLEKWAGLWMRGIFQNSGQNCIGIERLLVHSSQYDDLHEILSRKISKLRPGSVLSPSTEGYVPTVDCGSMISRERFPGLERIIREAEEAGANVLGGNQYHHVYLENGSYFTPTLVGPVDPEMSIAKEELFAPIAVLMQYETIDEAIHIANSTRYGLGASVFGPDQQQALKVAKQLECGMVSINDFAVFYINQDMPFGGTKASGYGRFGGPEGLRSLTNPKSIMVDRWPFVIQTIIPKVLDYPMRSMSRSWEFSSNLIQFLYADDWRIRIRGLVALVGAARK